MPYDEVWIDLIIGGRLIADLTEKLTFTLHGDIGGFGVSSDLTWNVSGFLGYQFTPLLSAWIGYRALGVDYETGSGKNQFKYEMTVSGPIIDLGLVFRRNIHTMAGQLKIGFLRYRNSRSFSSRQKPDFFKQCFI